MHISVGNHGSQQTTSSPSPQRIAAGEVHDALRSTPIPSTGDGKTGESTLARPGSAPPAVRLTKVQSARLADFSARLARALLVIGNVLRAYDASALAALASQCEDNADALSSASRNRVDFHLLARGIRTAEKSLIAMGGNPTSPKMSRGGLFRRRAAQRVEGVSLESKMLQQLYRDEAVLQRFLKKSGYPVAPYETATDTPAQVAPRDIAVGAAS